MDPPGFFFFLKQETGLNCTLYLRSGDLPACLQRLFSEGQKQDDRHTGSVFVSIPFIHTDRVSTTLIAESHKCRYGLSLLRRSDDCLECLNDFLRVNTRTSKWRLLANKASVSSVQL